MDLSAEWFYMTRLRKKPPRKKKKRKRREKQQAPDCRLK